MRLRKKILLSVVIITVLTIVSTSIIAQFLLLDQIRDYEMKTAGQELQGLCWIINEKIRSEELTAVDWAEWDDTYEFVQNRNEAYISSALVKDTYFSTEVNLMLFINESGEIVHGRAFDLEEKKEIDIPEELRQSLINHGILYNNTREFKSSAGLLVFDNSVMLISAYTILTSKGEGPVKGILIRGSYIDPGEMAKGLGSNADSFTIGGIPIYKNEYGALPDKGEVVYRIDEGAFPGDWGNIHAITYFNDIYGRPLTLEIEMQRDVYIQGVSTLYFIIVAIIIIGIISAGIYLIIFRKSVILQLDTLREDAGGIAESKDIRRRVDFEGDPEFMHLADSINKMLASLETATTEKIESERKYRDLFSSSLDGIVLTDMEGMIIDANMAFMDMTGNPLKQGGRYDSALSFFEMLSIKCDPEIINEMTEQWKKKKKSLKFESDLINSGKERLPVELTAWPLRNENNTILGIWWLIRDISEKKEIEKIRSEALSRIEDNLERMAILNDEIRNPLSIIVGLADIKCEAASKEIIEQVEKIDHIINLLDRGWLSSKKVHQFLKKQYLFEGEKEEANGSGEQEDTK
ncbi:MAG: PAS domain-containing protein [Methanomicrobiaceae archaeon]|nr:PAS domain-containing protein [Methanomicrobiaceae archaeon]